MPQSRGLGGLLRSDSVECRALVLLVLLGPLGVLAGMSFAPWPRTKGVLSATAAACLVPVALFTTTTAGLGHEHDVVFLGSTAPVAWGGVMLGRILGRRWRL